MKIKQIINAMLEDDRLVFNARTLIEAETFVDVCKDVLIERDLLDIDEADELLSGRDCYSIYGDQTCFTLELCILEHASKEYFEEDFKDYNIFTIDDILA